METVERNAQQALVLHKTKRASDLTTRSRALEEIAEALDLDSAPLRIECYDISHLQGDDVVASMVVFEDGLAAQERVPPLPDQGLRGPGRRPVHARGDRPPLPALPRARSEKTGEWAEDRPTGRRAEATPRTPRTPRHRGHGSPRRGELRCRGPPDRRGRPPKRFAYPPQLVVVDGGQPQVAAARRALDELGIDDVAVCGLAKRLEEVWLPGEDDPVVLPRSSEGLYLLQRVRDEAHRFAITYQRSQARQALPRRPARRRARSRRDPQAGADQALRLGEEAAGRDGRGDLRGPGHRPQDGRDVAAALAGRPGRPRREHGHRRDHGGRTRPHPAADARRGQER